MSFEKKQTLKEIVYQLKLIESSWHDHGWLTKLLLKIWGRQGGFFHHHGTNNLLRFFKKSTTSHAIQQRSCPSSFEVNVQKMARVRIELKFWWKFSQIIIIFWGQFLPPAVYLSALFEVILTWRWSCWVVAPFNKKRLREIMFYFVTTHKLVMSNRQALSRGWRSPPTSRIKRLNSVSSEQFSYTLL